MFFTSFCSKESVLIFIFIIMPLFKKSDNKVKDKYSKSNAHTKEDFKAREPRDDPSADYDVNSAVAEITEKQEEVLERIKDGENQG